MVLGFFNLPLNLSPSLLHIFVCIPVSKQHNFCGRAWWLVTCWWVKETDAMQISSCKTTLTSNICIKFHLHAPKIEANNNEKAKDVINTSSWMCIFSGCSPEFFMLFNNNLNGTRRNHSGKETWLLVLVTAMLGSLLADHPGLHPCTLLLSQELPPEFPYLYLCTLYPLHLPTCSLSIGCSSVWV